jgi:hypothetical protein
LEDPQGQPPQRRDPFSNLQPCLCMAAMTSAQQIFIGLKSFLVENLSKIKRFRKATCGYLIWFWDANHLPFAASLRFWTLTVSNFKSQAAWNQSCCQSEMRLWPSKRKTVHFCISSCFLTVTRLHRLGPGIFISPKFTLYICRKTAGINYTRIYSIYSHSRNVCLCLFQALQASTARWLPLYGQSSETTTIPIVDDEATTMQKIKTEESWKNGPRIQ